MNQNIPALESKLYRWKYLSTNWRYLCVLSFHANISVIFYLFFIKTHDFCLDLWVREERAKKFRFKILYKLKLYYRGPTHCGLRVKLQNRCCIIEIKTCHLALRVDWLFFNKKINKVGIEKSAILNITILVFKKNCFLPSGWNQTVQNIYLPKL